MTHRARVVVLRALGLGDLLTGVPALRALRSALPTHHLVLATPAPLAPLAFHAGVADEVVDTRGLDGRIAVEGAVDVAVNLHGRGPESHGLLRELEPRRLIAFGDGAPWIDDEHDVVRWCRLLQADDIPADPARLDLAPLAPSPRAGATVVHPGAASGARRWPPSRWAAVARAEAGAGRDVVITGGPDEVALGLDVARRAGLGERAVLAGRTDVIALARLVSGAGRVVCGDTGVAHLATALGAPSVVLFGPVAPRHWGPPPDRGWHRAIWKGAVGDPHATRPHPGLLAIGVDEVLDALASLPPAPRRNAAA
jgi:ADP-heptose:LPS heptosyltransferase